MTLLLDTHTFLWFWWDDPRLSNVARGVIRDPSNRKLISTASCWEIAIKVKIGKLDAAEVLKDFEAKATRAKLTMLGTTVPQVIRSGSLPLHHRDPFDRLLIAQAFELRIPILSSDRIMDLYGVQRIWD